MNTTLPVRLTRRTVLEVFSRYVAKPAGDYNPDWAIVMDGREVEYKVVSDASELP